MPDIVVQLPSRGVSVSFPDDATPEEIQSILDRDYPRNGQDVVYALNEDPSFAKKISTEDYALYEQFMEDRKVDFVQTAATGAGVIGTTIARGVRGLFDLQNLNPASAGATALESGAQGTRELYGMLAQSEDPSSIMFRFKDWINGTGTPEERKRQWLEARDFADRTRQLTEGQTTVTGIDPALVNNDVKNMVSLIADPTLLIPGLGEVFGAGRLATRAVGLGAEAAGRAAQVVTKPLTAGIEAGTKLAADAFGAEARTLRGVAAGTGISGAVMGLPGAATAVGVVGAIEGADIAAEVLQRAGQQLANAPTRIGPLEALMLNPNATVIDKALAKVGRYGGDALIDIGLRSGAGAIEGAAIGAGLGYLSAGEEGAATGLGSGAVLGATGAGAVRTYDMASGKAAAQARAADYGRFRENLSDSDGALWDKVANRDGVDAAVGLMDMLAAARTKYNQVDTIVTDAKGMAEAGLGTTRGAALVDAGSSRPRIYINADSTRPDLTAAHELFHIFEKVEQTAPKTEALRQEITGTYLVTPDGKINLVRPGLLKPDQVEAAHEQYIKRLEKSGVTGPDLDVWKNAKTIDQKASVVSRELGAEYMLKLMRGSDPDAMLRGFDGITRTLLDYSLMRNADGVLRGMAEKFGLGTKPAESLLFDKLPNASPQVNAMLRDLVRSYRNLNERIEVAGRSGGTVFNRKALANPAGASVAVKAGVAETRPDGTTRLLSQDELEQRDVQEGKALADIVGNTPIGDSTKPYLRIVDDKVVGNGISPEQIEAIANSPLISNKLRENILAFDQSLRAKDTPNEANVVWIEYAPALTRKKDRFTGIWKSVYSSGIRITQRKIAPYRLEFNKGDMPYVFAVDVTKLMDRAADKAMAGKLGAYGRDFDGFVSDVVRYFENISDPAGKRTADLPGMTSEKASFLNEFFGGSEKGGAEFIRSFRLDRITELRQTGERLASSDLAWQRQKISWMPAKKVGDGQVVQSPEGYRIINKGKNWHLYGPDGERIGIYETQAKAESRANDKVANALPRRTLGNTPNTTRDENGNIYFKGKAPKDWSPEDFEAFGKEHGVGNLGPLSPIREVATGLAGNPARIPGGLEGKFTYYDLLWLKANPVDVKALPEQTHAQLTAKLARTMAPELGDKVSSFNSIVFGMLSPNAPLLPNEIGQARLRFGSMDEIRKFAALYPQNPTPDNLAKLNDELKKKLGFIAAGKGGLGIPITANLANIVNAARLFTKNPDFFVKQPNESWANFVDKLTTQVAGFGTKTGSFGSVWQDPLNASISAMDRHMARIFGEELMGNKELRQRFEGIIVDRFNKLLSDAKRTSNAFAKEIAGTTNEKAKATLVAKRDKELASLPDPSAAKAKSIDDVLGQAQIYGPERVRGFVNEAVFAAMGSRKATLITAKGGINPNAPDNIKSIEWIETPQDFQVMSDAYRSALEINERRAKDLGVEVFPAQWTLWDRIRQRVEPHEAMFPGLEKLPALNDAQLGEAYKANKVAGYMTTPKPGETWKRSQVKSPAQLAYFQPAAPDTPEFKKWFGNSKVVDKRGKPLVVYHGTNSDFTEFEPGRAGAMYFTPNREMARSGYGPNIVEAYLKIDKLADLTDPKSEAYKLAVNTFNERGGWASNEDAMEGRKNPNFDPATDHTWEIFDNPETDIWSELGKRGYDGVKLEEYDGNISFAVFEPTQIKSATGNRGTFDATNPDIRFQPAEQLPNGKVWRGQSGFSIIQKDGGNFRVYSPLGLIGVASSYEKAERLANKRAR